MPRKYETIWLKIKDNLDPDVWITVTVSNPSMIQTVINMVQLEKSRAQTARKALQLPQFGTLEIKREPALLKVHFRIKNAGAQL
jgi:hypothetical protein